MKNEDENVDLRFWAEVFKVVPEGKAYKWDKISDGLIAITISLLGHTAQETIYHIFANQPPHSKIIDLKMTQPGTELKQTSECFIYWKDLKTHKVWGLNFSTPDDALKFKELCTRNTNVDPEGLQLTKPPNQLEDDTLQAEIETSEYEPILADFSDFCNYPKQNIHIDGAQNPTHSIHSFYTIIQKSPPTFQRSKTLNTPCFQDLTSEAESSSTTITKSSISYQGPHPFVAPLQTFTCISSQPSYTQPCTIKFINNYIESNNDRAHQKYSLQSQVTPSFFEAGVRGDSCYDPQHSIAHHQIFPVRSYSLDKINPATLCNINRVNYLSNTHQAGEVSQFTSSCVCGKLPQFSYLPEATCSSHHASHQTASHNTQNLPQQSLGAKLYETDLLVHDLTHNENNFREIVIGSSPIKARPTRGVSKEPAASDQYKALVHKVLKEVGTFIPRKEDSCDPSPLSPARSLTPPIKSASFCELTRQGNNTNLDEAEDDSQVYLSSFLRRFNNALGYSHTDSNSSTTPPSLGYNIAKLNYPISSSTLDKSYEGPAASRLIKDNHPYKAIPPHPNYVSTEGTALIHSTTYNNNNCYTSDPITTTSRGNLVQRNAGTPNVIGHINAIPLKNVPRSISNSCPYISKSATMPSNSAHQQKIKDSASIFEKSLMTTQFVPYGYWSRAIRKTGWLNVKHWLTNKKNKLDLASKRSWKKYWICLKGPTLLFYATSDSDNPQAKRVLHHMVIIEGAIVQAVPEHPKKDNLFCISINSGDVFLIQAASYPELENWISAIHISCAASLARHHGKDNIIKILTHEILKLNYNIEMDSRMKHMGEAQLTVVSDVNNRQAILKQISKWEERIEQLALEQFRYKCYIASLQNSELPNPKCILVHSSKPMKACLSKLGVASTVSSFHAYVSCRTHCINAKTNPKTSGINTLGTSAIYPLSKTYTSAGSIDPTGNINENTSKSTHKKKSSHGTESPPTTGLHKRRSSTSLNHSKSNVTGHFSQPNTPTNGPLRSRRLGDKHSISTCVNSLTDSNIDDKFVLTPNGSLKFGDKIIKINLPKNEQLVVPLSETMKVEDLLLMVCKKKHYNPSEYFLKFRRPNPNNGMYFVPELLTLIETLTYSTIELYSKSVFQVELIRSSPSQKFGFSIQAEICSKIHKPDELVVYVAEVNKDSIGYHKGLSNGDEILSINKKSVSDLDMMFVEGLLQQSLKVVLIIRSCQIEPPKRGEKFSKNISVDDLNNSLKQHSYDHEGKAKSLKMPSHSSQDRFQRGDNIRCPVPFNKDILIENLQSPPVVLPHHNANSSLNRAHEDNSKRGDGKDKNANLAGEILSELKEMPDLSCEQLDLMLQNADQITAFCEILQGKQRPKKLFQTPISQASCSYSAQQNKDAFQNIRDRSGSHKNLDSRITNLTQTNDTKYSSSHLIDTKKIGSLIMDFIQSEKLYIDVLGTLLKCYNDKSYDIPQVNCMTELLGNIEEIYLFQRYFLNSIIELMRKSASTKCEPDELFLSLTVMIADSFIKFSPYFKLYSTYCALYYKARKHLIARESNDERGSKSKSYGDLLITLTLPNQRIIHYPVLLHKLISYLGLKEIKESKKLGCALKTMELIAEHINGMQRIQEEFGSIFDTLGLEYAAHVNSKRKMSAASKHTGGQMFRKDSGTLSDDYYQANCDGVNNAEKPIDLTIGDLLLCDHVDWFNIPDEPWKGAKSYSVLPCILFVFKGAIVILSINPDKFKESKSKPPSSSKETSTLPEECINHKFLIPSKYIVRLTTLTSDCKELFFWDLYYLNWLLIGNDGRPQEKYLRLSTRSKQLRQRFLDTIFQTKNTPNSMSSSKSCDDILIYKSIAENPTCVYNGTTALPSFKPNHIRRSNTRASANITITSSCDLTNPSYIPTNNIQRGQEKVIINHTPPLEKSAINHTTPNMTACSSSVIHKGPTKLTKSKGIATITETIETNLDHFSISESDFTLNFSTNSVNSYPPGFSKGFDYDDALPHRTLSFSSVAVISILPQSVSTATLTLSTTSSNVNKPCDLATHMATTSKQNSNSQYLCSPNWELSTKSRTPSPVWKPLEVKHNPSESNHRSIASKLIANKSGSVSDKNHNKSHINTYISDFL